MPWEWHEPIFAKGRELGLTTFSTPINGTAVDFLEDLNCPAYKIASFEAIDLPLIKKAASTGKPLIISTGMADENEIEEAVTAAREGGCDELLLLHAISGYPTPLGEANLNTIPDMIARFHVPVGLSDHTMGPVAPLVATALGAMAIEKHITLSRADGGHDSAFSLEPDELKALCEDTKNAWAAMGKVNYEPKPSEKANLVFRRSLYVVQDIKAGERFTEENVRSIRPGYGLPPKHLPDILEMCATRDIKRGIALDWSFASRDDTT